jgi:hypothetical protein
MDAGHRRDRSLIPADARTPYRVTKPHPVHLEGYDHLHARARIALMGALLLILAIALLCLASLLSGMAAASTRACGVVRRRTPVTAPAFDELAQAKASLLANT